MAVLVPSRCTVMQVKDRVVILTVLGVERLLNYSCAIHVLWMRRYRTTRDGNTLIPLAFAKMTACGDFKPIRPIQ
jgi:hypothetical protein